MEEAYHLELCLAACNSTGAMMDLTHRARISGDFQLLKKLGNVIDSAALNTLYPHTLQNMIIISTFLIQMTLFFL